MLQLMCKNVPVYDIETNEALLFDLLPGIMQAECTRQNFSAWCQGRYSLKSNVYGRVQRAEMYPYNTPSEIDKLSGAFSLSINFTSEDVMYEPADMSAAFYEDAQMDTPLPLPRSVVEKLGGFGELMLVFDSIVGNYDRHLGNFGFLRDSNSGAVLGNAPLFDFDQASPRSINDARLLTLCTHKQAVLDMCRVIYDNTDRWEYKANCEKYLNGPQ
jgi:hypothetical protein